MPQVFDTPLDGLLDFHAEMTLEGERLTEAEISALLAGTDDLMLLRGRWVEVDRHRLGRTMQRFREAERLAEQDGLTFAEAMRMLAGAAIADDPGDAAAPDWSHVTAGPWPGRRSGVRLRCSAALAMRYLVSRLANVRALTASLATPCLRTDTYGLCKNTGEMTLVSEAAFQGDTGHLHFSVLKKKFCLLHTLHKQPAMRRQPHGLLKSSNKMTPRQAAHRRQFGYSRNVVEVVEKTANNIPLLRQRQHSTTSARFGHRRARF